MNGSRSIAAVALALLITVSVVEAAQAAGPAQPAQPSRRVRPARPSTAKAKQSAPSPAKSPAPRKAPSSRILVGKAAPDAPIKSLDGRDMSLASVRGNYVLLVFSDLKTRLLARAFLVQNAARLGSVSGLSVFNIMVPGQLLMPRAAWLYQARADAAASLEEARNSVMSHQLPGLAAVDFRWHADFNRDFSNLYRAPGSAVSLTLVDDSGYVVLQEFDAEEPAIQRVMKVLKGRMVAPGTAARAAVAPRPPLEAASAARQRAAALLGTSPEPRMRLKWRVDQESTQATEPAPAPAPEAPEAAEALVGPAGAPKGASKTRSRYHYRYIR